MNLPVTHVCTDQHSLDQALAADVTEPIRVDGPHDQLLRAVTLREARLIALGRTALECNGPDLSVDARDEAQIRVRSGVVSAHDRTVIRASGPTRVIADDHATVLCTREVGGGSSSLGVTWTRVDDIGELDPLGSQTPPVTIFAAPDCSGCDLTEAALSRAGIPHEVVQVDYLEHEMRTRPTPTTGITPGLGAGQELGVKRMDDGLSL